MCSTRLARPNPNPNPNPNPRTLTLTLTRPKAPHVTRPRPVSPQEEKRDREKEIQRANKEILDKFSEHVKQFEVEKVTRLQRETQTLKRVGDEVFRIQQKIGSERTAAWPK